MPTYYDDVNGTAGAGKGSSGLQYLGCFRDHPGRLREFSNSVGDQERWDTEEPEHGDAVYIFPRSLTPHVRIDLVTSSLRFSVRPPAPEIRTTTYSLTKTQFSGLDFCELFRRTLLHAFRAVAFPVVFDRRPPRQHPDEGHPDHRESFLSCATFPSRARCAKTVVVRYKCRFSGFSSAESAVVASGLLAVFRRPTASLPAPATGEWRAPIRLIPPFLLACVSSGRRTYAHIQNSPRTSFLA